MDFLKNLFIALTACPYFLLLEWISGKPWIFFINLHKHSLQENFSGKFFFVKSEECDIDLNVTLYMLMHLNKIQSEQLYQKLPEG